MAISCSSNQPVVPANRRGEPLPRAGASQPLSLPGGGEPADRIPAGDAAGSTDFAVDARVLFRAVTCTGDAPLPANVDPAVLAAHCEEFLPRLESYRRYYRQKIEPFFDAVRPTGLPETVVYPFGGGDLLSALNTYPSAREITTLSLELSGDPRRFATLDGTQVETSLAEFRTLVKGLLSQNNSTSEALQHGQQGGLPGQLTFFLTAAAIHGYEPISLRYFVLRPDGAVHYLTDSEIRGQESRAARRRRMTWVSPDFSEAFANSELVLRPLGTGTSAGDITHRHIAADLSDAALRKDPSVLNYLKGRGRISAMTKAASYLLWNPGFALVRQRLLESMEYMVSDSTGIPPEFASAAGFVQETYGHFSGSFLEASPAYNQQFRDLWAGQPVRALPFRYGYLDSSRAFHLLITHK